MPGVHVAGSICSDSSGSDKARKLLHGELLHALIHTWDEMHPIDRFTGSKLLLNCFYCRCWLFRCLMHGTLALQRCSRFDFLVCLKKKVLGQIESKTPFLYCTSTTLNCQNQDFIKFPGVCTLRNCLDKKLETAEEKQQDQTEREKG